MNAKRVLLWTALAITTILSVLIVAAIVVVHTAAFQRFVLEQIEQKTQASFGARLNIERMAINWRLFTIDFYGIVLHGRESSSQPALFGADHLRVGLKIASILQRKVDLNEIVLDQPVAHLNVDRNGNSNLPQSPSPPGKTGSTVANILDLAIQHVEVNLGQIYYNDQESPLSAELRDFRAQIRFIPLATEYRGTLAYGDGRVAAKSFRPITHRLQLNFAAGRSGMAVDPITLTTAKSTLNVHAKLTDYDNPHVEGRYDGVVSTTELRQFANNESIPAGEVALNGALRYDNQQNKSVVDSAYLDGRMNSRQLVMSMGRMEASAKSIHGEYRLQDGNLRVRNVEADLLGGHIGANYELSHISGSSSSRLQASVQNVSLEAMNDTAKVRNREIVRVSGRVDGMVGATWTSSIQNGVARAHFVIRNPRQPAVGDTVIPLNGLVDVAYEGARNIASFGQSYLRTGNTTVSVTGVLSERSQLDVQANTTNLHEVVALTSAFNSGSSAEGTSASPLPSDVGGSARFSGQVLGSVKEPRIKGELSASDLRVQSARWRSLRVSLDASSSGASMQNGVLEGAQKGQISFSGHADLVAWSLAPSSPLSLQATARQISISDLQQLTQSQYPVTGVLAANISIHGTEQNPEGQGSIQISQASAWNEPVNNLNIGFQGDGNSIHSNAQLVFPAGSLTAVLTYQPKTQSYDVNLRAPNVKLDQLQSVQARDLGVAGNLSFSATGQGTIKKPQITANVQIPKLEVRDEVISDVQAQLNVANEHADFTLSSKADQGSIQAKGNVGLDGEYPANASIDIRAIPVAVVLAHYLPKNQKIQGQAELHANLNGPLKNPYAIAAQLEIPTLNVNYQAAQLALVHPLRVSYRNGVATIEQADLKGTGTNLSLKGVIPIKAAGQLNVSANGTIDLSLLQAFAAGVQSSGNINLDVSARGDLSHPAMQGKIDIVNAAVSTETIPVGFEGVTGQIQMSGNRLEITRFSGAAGGGTVSARGFLTYGEQSNFNLGLDAKSVRVRYPEGIRSILTGNLALSGNPSSSQLTGRVLVDRLSFTQQFDLATLLGQFSTDTPATTASPFEQNMKLNVAVATADDLNLASSKVSMGGAANLTVAGTMASPVVLGRATLTSGEVFFIGKRYEIQSGTIEFANPVRTVPVVNLYVKTTVQQYNVTINFVGPMDRLRTNYTSDPPLPPADIINLVAFGKTSEQAATSPSTPATLGAESVLAQGAAGQLSGKLERLTGISQLKIDPLAGNSQSNPGAQVAIQQRVTGNILLTFSTDVTSTQNQAIQVQYQVKKNLAVSALRDQYGGYAADMRIHKTF
jgi:translocation and assembly module TamB